MLLVNHHKVTTKKKYHKILYLYPAFNETFVFLGMLGLRQDCVTHMDKQGNVLFEHVFDKPMDSFGMLSQREAIMIETRGNCITVLDLEKHQFRRTPHHFFNEESDQAQIVTYGDTKYLCIQEYGRYNDNRYKLSYYNYPPGPADKPFNVYEAKDDEWTHQYISKKGNAHSMMCWFKARHDQEWMFKTYDIRDDPNGKYNVYRFPQQMGVQYNMAKQQVAMNTMWETSKNVFMLVCISNKSDNQKNKQLDVIQNNYICDTKKGTVRQAKFGFGWYHDYLIDQTYMGPTCMFRTFNFENGKPLPAPVFYINNQTEEIVAKEEWECSYLFKFESPGYDSGMIIENVYENGDCEWFECSSKKVMNPKEISMHLMLSLNDEFDDDLLQDVVELIDYSK